MIDISIYKDSDKDDQDFFKLEHVSTLSHTLSLKPPSIHDNNQSIGNTNEYLLDPFDDNSDTENTNGFRVRSSNASVWSVEDDEDWGDLEIPCSQTLTWIPKDHSTLPFSSSSQLKNNDNSNRNTFLSASHLCVDDDDEDFEEGFQFDSKENTIIQFPLLHHVPLHSHVDGFEKVDFPTNIIHHQDDTNTIQKKCFILALNPSLSNTTTIVPQSMESNKIDLIPLIFSESHTPFDTKHVDDSIDIDSIDIDNNDIDSIDIDNVDIDNVDIDNIKIDKVRIDTAEFDNVNEMNDESNEDKMMKKKPMLITLDMMNGMNQNISLQSSTSFDSFDELDEKNVDELDDQQKQNRKCGSNEEKMMKKKPMLITLDMMNGMNQKMPSIPAATLVQQKSNLTLTTKTKTPKSMTISKKQSHKTSEDQSKKDTKKKSSTLIKSSTTSTTNGTPNATLKSINPTPPPRNLSRQSSTEEIDKRKAWVSYSKASLTKPVPRLSLSNEKMSLKQHPIVKSKETSSLSNSREDLRKPPINSHPNSSDKTGTIHSGALHSTKVFVKRPTTSTLVKHGFNDTLLSRPHSVLSTNSVTNPGGPPERWSSGSTRDMKRPPTHRVAFGRTLKDAPPPCQPQIKPKIRKQPTLIRNLGTSETPKVVGSMVYDPIAKKWTGNEQSLQIFEKMGKPVKKPTLIPHQPVKSGNGNGGTEKIGGMVFDPVNCVWVGNEEEEDAHLFDEIDAFENNHSSKTAAKMGLLCNKALRDDWNKSETRHKLLIGSWYPRACDSRFIRDSSRTYLWEIKTALLQR